MIDLDAHMEMLKTAYRPHIRKQLDAIFNGGPFTKLYETCPSGFAAELRKEKFLDIDTLTDAQVDAIWKAYRETLSDSGL